MPKQASSKPTHKVIVMSLVASIMTILAPYLADTVGFGPEEIEATRTLIEFGFMAVATLVATFLAGYFKSPGPNDGIVEG